jgi:Dolichyl-phosphate-mannose-protein mannosyltransferase
MLRFVRRHPPSGTDGGRAFDAAAILLLAGLAIIALLTFQHYAISNDEQVQHRYGELILSYYASGFADQSAFHFKNLYLYGGLFDVVAVALGRILPFDLFDIRHVLCALIGIAGIGATWATARLVAGPRAALLAAIALASCGAWHGAMFNHTKDIPFAAAMMGATYFLLRIGRDLPRPRALHILGFALMLGAALGLRVTGLVLIGYAGLIVLARTPLPAAGRFGETARFWMRCALVFAPALVLAYLLMIAAWPWAAQSPLNPLRALNDFAQFHYEIRTLLFGHLYTMADVPRWYVPAYLLIKLTGPILIGIVLALAFAVWPDRANAETGARRRLETGFIAFTAAFPVACHAIAHGPAFTGLRHFLFVVPPLTVLAGIGFDALLSSLAARRAAYALAASLALAAGLASDAVTLVRLHPYEYLFYNDLVGGLAGAARRNETDYWVNIMPEAVEKLESFIDKTQLGYVAVPWRRYTVGVCGERFSFENEADSRFQWVSDWTKAEFFIAPTHLDCDGAAAGQVIATIERLGVPIGVVKDRRALLPRAVARIR